MRKFCMLLAVTAFCVCLGAAAVWAQSSLSADLMTAVETPLPDFDTVEALVNRGADVNMADENGETALMKAARTNDDIMVAELLTGWGADINAEDDNGETAFMKAAQYNLNPGMTELLGRLGANVDWVDVKGETALMKACAHTVNPEVVMTVLMLKADAKITANKKTALDFAKSNPALKDSPALEVLKELSK